MVANMSFYHPHSLLRSSLPEWMQSIAVLRCILIHAERLLNRLDLSLDSMDSSQEPPFGFGGM